MQGIKPLLVLLTASIMLVTSTMQIFCQVAAPAKYTLQKDLVYKTVNDWQGRLDLYVPDSGQQFPLLINVHGGGWVHGKKETETMFVPFLNQKYVVANVEYRLADQAIAPAAIEDVRCALFYLVNNAKKFKIDTRNIVLLGSSAGGHLALMAGLLKDKLVFDTSCSPNFPFRIAAIIDRYGPTNLNSWDAIKKPGKASSTWVGNNTYDSFFLQSVSPINYIDRNTPAIFIVHGDKDHTVAYEQSLELLQKLKTSDTPVDIYIVPGGMHGNFSPQQNEEIWKRVNAFLNKNIDKTIL